MHHFAYRDGVLNAEGVALSHIAQKVGTPVYVYASATLVRHYKVFAEAFAGLDALICFAVKANSNVAVLKTLGDLGAGADVVSLGELKRAMAAGIPASRIVFSGVGKTAAEMAAALAAGIYQFNVESEPELELLNAVARDMERIAPVTLRINPDVDAGTHAKIATGKAENKFGIPWRRARAAYGMAARLPGLHVVGVDVHIGSQLTALAPFRQAFEKVAGLVAALRRDGHAIARLDLGGGLGIPYEPDKAPPPAPAEYGRMIAEVAGTLDCRIILEPGRLIAGNAGVLLTRVLYVKEGEARRFVILDAAMNDLIRPAMYEAYHDIIPVMEPAVSCENIIADIVGPVCETGDIFARGRTIPLVKPGDLMAILSAGAYGSVMASTYNSRPLVPEVLVKGDEYAVIRDRPPLDALIAMDTMPPWLDNGRKRD
ncbi:MAG: diaminopimelate decarboxylase [Pseudomonadota bacterium]